MAACWEIVAHSASDMFSKYSYLIVNLVVSHLGIWSVNFLLIAPFPDHCLLVLFRVSFPLVKWILAAFLNSYMVAYFHRETTMPASLASVDHLPYRQMLEMHLCVGLRRMTVVELSCLHCRQSNFLCDEFP